MTPSQAGVCAPLSATPMAVHVAILLPRYVRLILSGRKTMESRLTRNPIAPWRRVAPGDRIFFRASSGPYRATAVAQSVDFFADLTPSAVDHLRRRFNHAVCGDAGYWRMKRTARYGTLIRLGDVQTADRGPALPPSRGLAWFALPTPAEAPPPSPMPPPRLAPPAVEVALTAGAIRNRYLRLGVGRVGPIHLVLPDGREVGTHVGSRGMVRWRGWGAYYLEHGLRAGDRVRLAPLSDGRYRVVFLPEGRRVEHVRGA